jgi:hypothetical protein
MEAISIRAIAPQGGKDTAEAERAFERLVGWRASKRARALALHEVERREEEQLREVARLLQEHINARGQGAVGHGIKRVTGELLTEHRVQERGYVSIFGKVTIRRVAYGAEGGRSLMPLDEQLNLPQRSYSYELQKRVTRQVALGPVAAARETLTEWSGVSLPKRRVEARAVEAAQDGAQFYDHKTPAPDTPTSEVLVCPAEGKGVPLRRAQPQERPRRGQKGPPPGETKMATVAAVYTIAPYQRSAQEIVREVHREPPAVPAASPRPHPEHKRVGASLKKDKDAMFDEMAAEMHKRDPGRQKTWAFLCDGEEALQKRARAVLGAVGATLSVILDLFHVLEYLGKAAAAFHPVGSPGAEQWVSQQLLALLQERVSRVAASLRQRATKRGLRGQRRQAVDTAAHYFLKNKAFMRYHEYLALGLPIGSGAAEGACRHLIKDRRERTGMRWSVDGAEAVIQLRATELSGDWEEYWHYHIAAQRRRLYPENAWQPAKTKPLLRQVS